MSNYYLGEMFLFAGNFAPKDTVLCQGQLLPISTNQALFSLLGTAFGGDGRTGFGIPDLCGRVAAGYHDGSPPNNRINGLLNRGQKYGTEAIFLTDANLPAHTHTVPQNQQVAELAISTADAKIGGPNFADGDYVARPTNGNNRTEVFNMFVPSGVGTDVVVQGASLTNASATVQPSGVGNPLDIVQPTIALNWCMAINGTYPARN